VYALSPPAVTGVRVHGRREAEEGRLAADEAGLLADVRALTRDWRI